MLAVLLPTPVAVSDAAVRIANGDLEAADATGQSPQGWIYIQPPTSTASTSTVQVFDFMTSSSHKNRRSRTV
jgi:hypothetical protein